MDGSCGSSKVEDEVETHTSGQDRSAPGWPSVEALFRLHSPGARLGLCCSVKPRRPRTYEECGLEVFAIFLTNRWDRGKEQRETTAMLRIRPMIILARQAGKHTSTSQRRQERASADTTTTWNESRGTVESMSRWTTQSGLVSSVTAAIQSEPNMW